MKVHPGGVVVFSLLLTLFFLWVLHQPGLSSSGYPLVECLDDLVGHILAQPANRMLPQDGLDALGAVAAETGLCGEILDLVDLLLGGWAFSRHRGISPQGRLVEGGDLLPGQLFAGSGSGSRCYTNVHGPALRAFRTVFSSTSRSCAIFSG